VEAALREFRGRLVGIGITGDQLYSEDDVRGWVEPVGATYRSIDSPYGHDAFLLEIEQVAAIVEEALAGAAELTSTQDHPGADIENGEAVDNE
jgi:homoserine O-acetyltransferase